MSVLTNKGIVNIVDLDFVAENHMNLEPMAVTALLEEITLMFVLLSRTTTKKVSKLQTLRLLSINIIQKSPEFKIIF